MSLDVMLYITYPKCEHCGREELTEYIYSANITHNLGRMAGEAGIYEALWRPEEIGITHAEELIIPLIEGLTKLKNNPELYKKFDSPNGWGMYDHFIPWIEEYLEACVCNPDAYVSVSR